MVNRSEIKNGQIVLAINWKKQSLITTIVSKNHTKGNLVNYSDEAGPEIVLADTLDNSFKGSFLFNLSSDVIALIDHEGKIFSINNFTSAIQSTLRYEFIKRAGLGIYYIDISNFILPDSVKETLNNVEKGALIYKNDKGIAILNGSSAFKAGLKEGDIITSIDNREINEDNDLVEILLDYVAGDEIDIVYIRNGREKEVKIKLGEIK